MSTDSDIEPPANAAVTSSQPSARSSTALVAANPSDYGAPITLYDKVDNVIQFLGGLSDSVFKSGAFKGAPAAMCDIIALECMARKQTPLQLAQTFHVFDGKLSMRADAILAEFNRLGGEHRIITRTFDEAAIELKWKKDKTIFRFTWEEAKQEPFVYDKNMQIKTNWATPRARMQLLWARVVSDGVRAVCPRVNSGRYTPEEIADFDDTPVQRVSHSAPPQPSPVAAKPVSSAATAVAAEVVPAVVKESSSSSPSQAVSVPVVTPPVAAPTENDDAIDADFTITADPPVTAAAVEEPPFDIHPLVESDETIRTRIIDFLTSAKKDMGIVKADWLKLLGKYGAGVDSAKKLTTAQLQDFQSRLTPGYEQHKTTGKINEWLDGVLGK
jgi:hypothetical protein